MEKNVMDHFGGRPAKGFVALVGLVLAAGCSGGSDDGDEPQTVDVVPSQFIGQTDLRYFGVDGDPNDSDGNYLVRFGENGDFQAKVSVVDGDTIVFTTNEGGLETFVMNYDPERDRWIPVRQPFARYRMVDQGSDFLAFYLDPFPESGLPAGYVTSGGFGLPTEILPAGTATYSSNGYARVLLREGLDDSDNPSTDFVSIGGVDLTATFGEATPQVFGTVFSGSGFVNVDDDAADDDLMEFTIGMTADISGATFSATSLTPTATIDIDEFGDPDANTAEAVTFDLDKVKLDGAFYGDNAGYLNGSWEADFGLSDGADLDQSGAAVGYFEAGRTD